MTKFEIRLVAGAVLYEKLREEKRNTIPQNAAGYFESESLCRLQVQRANRGILGATLVLSMYGWSVRYDSGLQNFGLIASCRCGMLDGSLQMAEEFCRKWVAADPERRYAYGSNLDMAREEERLKVPA